MKKSIFLLILLMPLWIMAQSQSAHKRAIRQSFRNKTFIMSKDTLYDAGRAIALMVPIKVGSEYHYSVRHFSGEELFYLRAVRLWQNNIPYTPEPQPRTSILVYTFIFPTLAQGFDQAEVACRTSDLPNIIGQAKLIHEKGLHIENANDFVRKIGLPYTRPVGL